MINYNKIPQTVKTLMEELSAGYMETLLSSQFFYKSKILKTLI